MREDFSRILAELRKYGLLKWYNFRYIVTDTLKEKLRERGVPEEEIRRLFRSLSSLVPSVPESLKDVLREIHEEEKELYEKRTKELEEALKEMEDLGLLERRYPWERPTLLPINIRSILRGLGFKPEEINLFMDVHEKLFGRERVIRINDPPVGEYIRILKEAARRYRERMKDVPEDVEVELVSPKTFSYLSVWGELRNRVSGLAHWAGEELEREEIEKMAQDFKAFEEHITSVEREIKRKMWEYFSEVVKHLKKADVRKHANAIAYATRSCPYCGVPLEEEGEGLRCTSCGRTFTEETETLEPSDRLEPFLSIPFFRGGKRGEPLLIDVGRGYAINPRHPLVRKLRPSEASASP